MPITLAVLMIEVVRRAGLTLDGIGAPFHFLIKFHDPDRDEDRFPDPFHGGREIDQRTLSERLQATQTAALVRIPSPSSRRSPSGRCCNAF